MSFNAHERIDALEARLAELEKLVSEKMDAVDLRAGVVSAGVPPAQPGAAADAVSAFPGGVTLRRCVGAHPEAVMVVPAVARCTMRVSHAQQIVQWYCADHMNKWQGFFRGNHALLIEALDADT